MTSFGPTTFERGISGRESLPLAGLRQDLELLEGPLVAGVGQTWRIRDPARNRFFEIGPFEFEVLSDWPHARTLGDLAARLSARLQTRVNLDELLTILQFLIGNELLSAKSEVVRRTLFQHARASKKSWLRWLLHNYLFVRIPLFNPRPLLEWLAGKTGWIFSWKTGVLALALLVVDVALIIEHWSDVQHQIDYSFSLEGLVLLGLAGFLSKAVHEIGHATVAHRMGVRVPAMGVSVVVLYPMLYTDTSDSWRLKSKRKRMAIVAAGMISEFSLSLVAIFAWSVFPEGPFRHALFFLAFVSFVVALGINALPFMRFDGYFLISDALDLPNMHERAAALALRWIRRGLWRLHSPDPEPQMSPKMRGFLVCFAVVTWLYRLAVYLVIALLVFHFFFKVLGVFLMAVELGWFVFRPIYQEFSYLKLHRKEVRPQWQRLFLLLTLTLVVGWLWLVNTSVASPAIARSRIELSIYTPTAGYLLNIQVREGQRLETGDDLGLLVSPESALHMGIAQIRREALHFQLQATAVDNDALESREAIRQRISSTQAAERLFLSEQDLMRLRAPTSGVVRDVLPSAVAGRWVQAREPLLRITSPADTVVYAYVEESSIHQIRLGASVVFYPDDVGLQPIRGKVAEVDNNGIRSLPSAMLASVFNGPIPAVRGPRGELTANEARYRVLIEPDVPTSIPRVLRGSVHIEGNVLWAITALPARVISAVMREFGM